ncbi:hypothetical protein [Clostridium sp. YIM B02551]|uniref:hypothetical protein n=1 Tax=Clostridium sp. YIM B02551 TaxID=2910679 RepID=UPI001EEA2D0E|nr:hypothetical protein [Clostridium sp. YIM B02551]
MEHYCKITNFKIDLLHSKKFEELLKVMYCQRQIGLIVGFGSICIYDSCLRFGVNSSVTLNPSNGSSKPMITPDYVYIHNGSENGAKNLFQSLSLAYNPKYHTWDNKKEFPYFQQSDFPSPLITLAPYHIENFLCIYEDQL